MKNMMLNSEEVAQYLREHPEFFEEYADMLAGIQVPHPHGGSAIPISERQIVALRDQNRILQAKLGELIKFGEENGAITEKMHRLSATLLASSHFDDFMDGLNYHLREDFSVPHLALRLWDFTAESPTLPEFAPVSTDTHVLAESLRHPYCGSHVLDEIRGWFGEDATRLRSFAIVALRAEQTIGLLILGSEDPQRFYPEMGIIYLAQLGELVSAGLRRFTANKHIDAT
jgi:uncharacterized protein YigA (DUF484 family)